MAKTRCHECGLDYEPGVDRDPCIGEVPGAYSACCGHGNPDHARILFGEPGHCELRLTGGAALGEFERLRDSGCAGRREAEVPDVRRAPLDRRRPLPRLPDLPHARLRDRPLDRGALRDPRSRPGRRAFPPDERAVALPARLLPRQPARHARQGAPALALEPDLLPRRPALPAPEVGQGPVLRQHHQRRGRRPRRVRRLGRRGPPGRPPAGHADHPAHGALRGPDRQRLDGPAPDDRARGLRRRHPGDRPAQDLPARRRLHRARHGRGQVPARAAHDVHPPGPD
jgi:hypothetical protein